MLFRCKFYAVPLVGQARHALGIRPHGRPVGGEAEFAVGPAEAVEEMAGTEIRLAVMPALHAQSLDIGRSEEHTSELQSLMRISYAVFCLKKKTNIQRQ